MALYSARSYRGPGRARPRGTSPGAHRPQLVAGSEDRQAAPPPMRWGRQTRAGTGAHVHIGPVQRPGRPLPRPPGCPSGRRSGRPPGRTPRPHPKAQASSHHQPPRRLRPIGLNALSPAIPGPVRTAHRPFPGSFASFVPGLLSCPAPGSDPAPSRPPGQAAGPPHPRSQPSPAHADRRARLRRSGPDIRRSNTMPAHSGQREHAVAYLPGKPTRELARILHCENQAETPIGLRIETRKPQPTSHIAEK